MDFMKSTQFDEPNVDYINLTYFGEKYSLEGYRSRYKLGIWDDIEPLQTDQALPPRVNGQQRVIDESHYKLNLLGNNKNPFMINYNWYHELKINNLLPNYFVFSRTNFQTI